MDVFNHEKHGYTDISVGRPPEPLDTKWFRAMRICAWANYVRSLGIDLQRIPLVPRGTKSASPINRRGRWSNWLRGVGKVEDEDLNTTDRTVARLLKSSHEIIPPSAVYKHGPAATPLWRLFELNIDTDPMIEVAVHEAASSIWKSLCEEIFYFRWAEHELDRLLSHPELESRWDQAHEEVMDCIERVNDVIRNISLVEFDKYGMVPKDIRFVVHFGGAFPTVIDKKGVCRAAYFSERLDLPFWKSTRSIE